MLIRNTCFCLTDPCATVRLDGQVFKMHHRPDLHGVQVTWCLQLPLQRGTSLAPQPDPASFLTLPSRAFASMESAYAEGRRRLASAGLDPLCMEDFLNLRLVDDSECDLWLLADLTGVRHYSHIPVVLAADPMSSDEEAV